MPTKLSLHVTRESPAALDFIRRAQPPILRLNDAFGMAAEVKGASPRTRIVGRARLDRQHEVGEGDPAQRAREWIESQKRVYLRHPEVDFWEGWSEPTVDSPQRMAWYADFEAERVRLLASLGRKACLGNFASGQPRDLTLWPYFFPALREGKKHGAVLGLHEFTASRIDSLPGKEKVQPKGEADRIPCRYRKVYRTYLHPAYLGIPLVITEASIDRAAVAEAHAQRRPTDEDLRQLAWYDERLQEDSYVWGAAISQARMAGKGRESFLGEGDLVNLLAEYAQERPNPSPPPIPSQRSRAGWAEVGPASAASSRLRPAAPLPPVTSAKSALAAAYVLLPPEASLELVQAAAAYFHAFRFTLGFNLEDALLSRRLVVVDPHRWPAAIQRRLQERSPGLEIEALSSSAIFSRSSRRT